MVFVGDYVYEGPVRVRILCVATVGGEARTVDDYRNRHAQYKTDVDLQALHAATPWLVTWDDHEVDNDYAGDAIRRPGPGVSATPLRRLPGLLRAHAVAPARRARERADMLLSPATTSAASRASHLLDGRQHRSPQVCPPPDEAAPTS